MADDCDHAPDREGALSGANVAGYVLFRLAEVAPGALEPVSNSHTSVMPPTIAEAMLLWE